MSLNCTLNNGEDSKSYIMYITPKTECKKNASNMGFRLCQIRTWVCLLQLWTSGSPSAVLASVCLSVKWDWPWPLPRIVGRDGTWDRFIRHPLCRHPLDVGLWGTTDLRKAECLYVRKRIWTALWFEPCWVWNRLSFSPSGHLERQGCHWGSH